MGKNGGRKRQQIKARRRDELRQKKIRSDNEHQRDYEMSLMYIPQFKFTKTTLKAYDTETYIQSLPMYPDDCKHFRYEFQLPDDAVAGLIGTLKKNCYRAYENREFKYLNRDCDAYRNIYITASDDKIPVVMGGVTGEHVRDNVWLFARNRFICPTTLYGINARNVQSVTAECHFVRPHIFLRLDALHNRYGSYYVDYKNRVIGSASGSCWTFDELGFDPETPYTSTGFRSKHVQVLLHNWGIPVGVDTAISSWVV